MFMAFRRSLRRLWQTGESEYRRVHGGAAYVGLEELGGKARLMYVLRQHDYIFLPELLRCPVLLCLTPY